MKLPEDPRWRLLKLAMMTIYADKKKIGVIKAKHKELSHDNDLHATIETLHRCMQRQIYETYFLPNVKAPVEIEFNLLFGATICTPVVVTFLRGAVDMSCEHAKMEHIDVELDLYVGCYYRIMKDLDFHLQNLRYFRNHMISKPQIGRKKRAFKQQINFFQEKKDQMLLLVMEQAYKLGELYKPFFDQLLSGSGICCHDLQKYGFLDIDLSCSLCGELMQMGVACLHCKYYQCKDCFRESLLDIEGPATIVVHCDWCGDPCTDKFLRCPCKSAAYCSHTCGKKHWKAHRKYCTERRS